MVDLRGEATERAPILVSSPTRSESDEEVVTEVWVVDENEAEPAEDPEEYPSAVEVEQERWEEQSTQAHRGIRSARLCDEVDGERGSQQSTDTIQVWAN